MPDRRRHRGAHPKDRESFGEGSIPVLRRATAELSWLLSRAYAERAAVKLVGDRYALTARQRLAITRSACTDAARTDRGARRVTCAELGERPVFVDGLNCLIIVESALSGGVVLRGRDGAHRDLASVHGTYRMVGETARSVELVAELLGSAPTTWWLDRPVANSGRLGGRIAAMAAEHGWPWSVELVDDPDRVLSKGGAVTVATADAAVLDRCGAWIDVPGEVIERFIPNAWVVDLGA